MNWHELFTYNADTGVLTWKERPIEHFKNWRAWRVFNSVYAGKEAGSKSYTPHRHPLAVQVGVKHPTGKKDFTAHRIIWEMMRGPIPLGIEIDHINGNAHDNRIDNLRLATHAQNMLNKRIHGNNTSGIKGVSFDKHRQKWRANIQMGHKAKHLGRFDTRELAAAAYAVASVELHGEFGRIA